MTIPSEILQSMIDNTDAQVENLDAGLTTIDEQISELTEQIDGIENGLCEVSKNDLVSYINDTKISELESLHGGELPYSFSQGENFGTIDVDNGGITDWEILDNLGSVVYKYEDLNWDNDSFITEKINDFAFGNKFLTKPLSGAAGYGLMTYKDFLVSSKTYFESAKDDLTQSKIIFAKYV
jgi:hypothetical protein